MFESNGRPKKQKKRKGLDINSVAKLPSTEFRKPFFKFIFISKVVKKISSPSDVGFVDKAVILKLGSMSQYQGFGGD